MALFFCCHVRFTPRQDSAILLAMSERVLDTVVIPLAGIGTRMAPFTGGVPKFMTPIVDGDRFRPTIDYTLYECLGAGIKNYVFVVSDGGQQQLEKYLGPLPQEKAEVYKQLGKIRELEAEIERRALLEDANFEYIEQTGNRYGTAVPLSLAKSALKGVEYFAITGGDDFVWHADGTSELALAKEAWSGAVHAIMGAPVTREDAPRLGILRVNDDGKLIEIMEKPDGSEGKPIPDRPLANISRYILTAERIWPLLDEYMGMPRSPEQPEYYVTDVINMAASQGFNVHRVQGAYLDAGTPAGVLHASQYIAAELSVRQASITE